MNEPVAITATAEGRQAIHVRRAREIPGDLLVVELREGKPR
jgi:hypothetical protein